MLYDPACKLSANLVRKHRIIHGDSLARGLKTNLGKVFQNLEKRIQVCLDVKGDQFQHRL